MQQNSFFLGCNYSNRDITDARTSWNLSSVQDIDTVLINRYSVNNVDDTFSLLYCDLYLRQLKETLKNTMLLHESVFEFQIHELHRLYRRQKELMMEMEETRHCTALYLNSSFPRTQFMSSSISTYRTKNFPYEENMLNEIEAVDNVEKVLDLELSVFGCHDIEEKRSLMNDEVANFLKEQSLESGNQSNKLELDLNEPAKIEEYSDQPSFVECQGEYGIDLNMSPHSSEEEVIIVQKFETEEPLESLHGKHGSEESRVLVLALPCSNSSLLLDKPLVRNSRLRKKVKLGPNKNNFKDSKSNLGLHLSAKTTSEAQSNQVSMKKGSSSSARNQTKLGKKMRCKPQIKSSKDQKVVAKKKRKKSRRISLVTEGDYKAISAAEAIVDMSRKSTQETSDSITSLSRNLLWFAEISSSVIEDYKSALPKQEEHNRILRKNSADNKTSVSNIVPAKQKRSWKCKDDPSLSRFSNCKANDDMQVLRKLIKASESKCDRGFIKNKRRSSHSKPIEILTTSVNERISVEWGAIRKRRRSSRVPASEFQHMIISQVAYPN